MYRRWPRLWDNRPQWAQRLMTFLLIVFGWVFFRAATLHDSVYVIQQMVSWHGKAGLIPVWLTCVLAASFVIALFEEKFEWIEHNVPSSELQ